jgi:hypothetical protein
VEGDRWVRGAAWLGVAVFGLGGLWAFVSPRLFFDTVAAFEPFNAHFVRDLGAFQIGFAAALLAALRTPGPLVAVLFGTGFGTAVHALGHFLDRDLGGNPWVDVPGLVILAAILLAASRRAARSAASR